MAPASSGSHDALLRLWDWQQETCSKALPGHTSWICGISSEWSNGGEGDQTVQLWDVRDGICCQTLQGHTSLVCSLSFSPNGQMLKSAVIKPCGSGMQDSTCLRTTRTYGGVWAVAFSPDGHPASGSSDQTVRLWDVQDNLPQNP